MKERLETNDEKVLKREKVWSKEEGSEIEGQAAPAEGQIVRADGEPKADI